MSLSDLSDDLVVPQACGDFSGGAAGLRGVSEFGHGALGGGVDGRLLLGTGDVGDGVMLPLFASQSASFGSIGPMDLMPTAGYPVGGMAPFFAQPHGLGLVQQQPPQPPLQPEAAVIAAGVRAQRASARQAAKAKQQHQSGQSGRRSQRAARGRSVVKSESDDSDEDGSDNDGMVPQRPGAGLVPDQPKPHDIAKTKYNHIEDEKERKRLKRLLRNRVSAQQARERKKAYLGSLESQTKATNDKIQGLEDRVAQLERENFMLRQVVKTSTGRDDMDFSVPQVS